MKISKPAAAGLWDCIRGLIGLRPRADGFTAAGLLNFPLNSSNDLSIFNQSHVIFVLLSGSDYRAFRADLDIHLLTDPDNEPFHEEPQ